MTITFTRRDGGVYTAVACRDDGVTVEVTGYEPKRPMPHDLAHYVVEAELGLHHGFWGRIAAGALYPGVKIVAGRQRPHAAQRSQAAIRQAESWGTEAEVLVGVLLRIADERLDERWPAAEALLRAEWRPAQPSRDPLDAAEVERVCQALRAIQEHWQALSIGQSLTVTWSLRRPENRPRTDRRPRSASARRRHPRTGDRHV